MISKTKNQTETFTNWHDKVELTWNVDFEFLEFFEWTNAWNAFLKLISCQ